MSESHWAMISTLHEESQDKMNEWKDEFVQDLYSRGHTRNLTDRQIEKLEAIYEDRT